MKSALLHSHDGQRTFALIFETGDEGMKGMAAFARAHQLKGSHLTVIRAFQRAVVASFDWQTKAYKRIPIDEQVEDGGHLIEGGCARHWK